LKEGIFFRYRKRPELSEKISPHLLKIDPQKAWTYGWRKNHGCDAGVGKNKNVYSQKI